MVYYLNITGKLLASFATNLIWILLFSAEVAGPVEEKRLASWGTDVPEDLVLDDKKLADALKKVNLVTVELSTCV